MIPEIESLDAVKGESQPVIVWFTVPGCPPCRAVEPRVMDFLEKHGRDCRVVRFDITKNPEVPQELEITSTPTFVFYKDGVEIGRLDGLPAVEDFEEMLMKTVKQKGGDRIG
ncbi:MAG: thioredoxin [Methanobacteriota archaeon]|nr:MAG: thioredoxin [Euryarchaeota archaeon]